MSCTMARTNRAPRASERSLPQSIAAKASVPPPVSEYVLQFRSAGARHSHDNYALG